MTRAEILAYAKDGARKEQLATETFAGNSKEIAQGLLDVIKQASTQEAASKEWSGVEVGVVSANGDYAKARGGKTTHYFPSAGAAITHGTNSKTVTMKSTGINQSPDDGTSKQLSDEQGDSRDLEGTVPTPWDLPLLKLLLLNNVIHAAIIETKAADYAYSGWTLSQTGETLRAVEDGRVKEDDVKDAEDVVRLFLSQCFDGLPVEDAARDLAIDYEALGMAGLEMIRSRSALLHSVKPIPFHTLHATTTKASMERYNGAKWLQQRNNNRRFYFDFEDTIEYREGFDPDTAAVEEFPSLEEREDFVSFKDDQVFAIDANKKLSFNDKTAFAKMATELFVLRRRPFTASQIYGTPGGIQAMSAMLAMQEIEQYNLNFFRSKGVPQYAIVLEGLTPPAPTLASAAGDLNNDVDAVAALEATIRDYFQNQLATSDRSVLIMTTFGTAKISFQPLSSETLEASFKEYEERSMDLIRVSHRIPAAAMGLSASEGALGGGGRDLAQMKRYRDHIVVPGQRQHATLINKLIRNGLLIPFFEFKFNPIDLNEDEILREFYLKAYEIGLISPDEARVLIPGSFKEIGEEAGGDMLYLRTPNVVTINQKIEELAASLNMQAKKVIAKFHAARDTINELLEISRSQDEHEGLISAREDDTPNNNGSA